MKNNIITAGVDEVGRGCLAGPVVSAAVILNDKIDLKSIKDSKKINFENRLKISKYIKENSIYAIGVASVEEIFDINILQATFDFYLTHICQKLILKLNKLKIKSKNKISFE